MDRLDTAVAVWDAMTMLANKSSATAGGTTNAERLIRRAHILLDQWGVTESLSASKVTRLVREFQRKAEPAGLRFEHYLLRALIEATDASLRRAAGQIFAADPDARQGPVRKSRNGMVARDQAVGETATWRVFLERDLPRHN